MKPRLQYTFEDRLLDVKWSQHAVNFCGLLFKASQDIIESEGNSYGMSNEEADKVLKELQDITDSTGASSVNPLAEAFLDRFRFKDSAEGRSKKTETEEVFASLLKIDEHERAKHACSKDYLKHMINNMESVVNTNNMRGCTYNRLVPLDKYLRTLTQHRDFEAETILNIIFNRGSSGREFTEDQQKTIGALMAEAIGPVLTYIKCNYSNRNCRMPAAREYRSALQILCDEYGKYPARNATLHQEFEKVNMIEAIKILDSNICLDGRSYQAYGSDDSDCSDDSDIEIYDGWNLPDIHMEWWSKVMSTKQAL